MAKIKKKPELKAVFDTNAIYSNTANNLINHELSNLIKDNLSHHDLEITWHFPETVIKEREFQMIKKGNELLIPVRKLESLLDHNLNITKKIIETRVKETIKNQMNDNLLQEIKLNIDEIDWTSLINCSLKRVPPFEDNKSEKGFRDALILESFDQLVNSSPKTPSSCRIAFVCNDKLLIEAAKERTKDFKNIRFLNDLTNLKGLINILVSETEENLINEISEAISNIFFEPENTETIFYKEDLRKEINDKYHDKMIEYPDEQTSRVDTGTWYISDPNFIKKVKQRIWWSSPIHINLTAYKTQRITQPTQRIGGFENPDSNSLWNYQNSFKEPQSRIGNLFKEALGSFESIKHLEGKSKFEVIWSITYTANKKLINPKIEEVKFIENNWDK